MTDTSEFNELDALLAGVEAPSGPVVDAVLASLSNEEPQPEPTKHKIDKAAIYGDQTSQLDVSSIKPKRTRAKKTETKAPEPDKTTKTLQAEPATPEVTGDADAVIRTRSEALSKKVDVNDLTKLGVDKDEIAGILSAMDTAPKKVSEKAYNMLRYALGREVLSNYTRFAFEQLGKAGAGGMTVPELVKAMETRWGTGTARSQSQQMSRLFGLFGMADKQNGRVTLKPEHPLVKHSLERLHVSWAPA